MGVFKMAKIYTIQGRMTTKRFNNVVAFPLAGKDYERRSLE